MQVLVGQLTHRDGREPARTAKSHIFTQSRCVVVESHLRANGAGIHLNGVARIGDIPNRQCTGAIIDNSKSRYRLAAYRQPIAEEQGGIAANHQ